MNKIDEGGSNPTEEADQPEDRKIVAKDKTSCNDEAVTESCACSESHADKGRKKPFKKFFRDLLTRVDKKLKKHVNDNLCVETVQEIDRPLPAPGPDTPAIVTDHSVSQYDFSHAERGVAVLVIYTEFDDERYNREYAKADKVNMRSMFSALGFNVIVLENYPVNVLEKELESIRSTMSSDVDCFACVLSSHGSESLGKDKHRSHIINTSDGAIETSSIVKHFGSELCWQLNGKPKLFFIQACRSKFTAKEGTENDPGVFIEVYQNRKLESVRFERQPLINSSKMDAKNSTDEHSTCSIPFADDDVPPGNTQTNEASNGQYSQAIRQADLTYRKTVQQSTEKNQRNTNNQYHCHNYQQLQQQTQEDLELKQIDDVEFFDVPCYNDCLVMFSSPPERLAWSDDYIGGWLPYCLFRVIEDLDSENFHEDFLQVLTRVSGKMALEMETRFAGDSAYYKNKSVACIYHKLTKDIILSKNISTQPTAKVTRV